MADNAQDVEEVHNITFEAKPDPIPPQADPASPQYDPEYARAYREQLDANTTQALTAARGRLSKLAVDMAKQQGFTPAQILELQATAASIRQELQTFLDSEMFRAIKESVAAVRGFVEEYRPEIEAMAEYTAELQHFAPFLQKELDAMQDDPRYADLTIEELFDNGIDEDGNETDSIFGQAIARARKRQEEFERQAQTVETVEQAQRELALIQSINPQYYVMPNNKLTNALQSGVDLGDNAGKVIGAGEFNLPILPANKKREEITAYTMVEYTGSVAIPGTITEYERVIMNSICSLFDEAKRQKIPPVFTVDMVYRAMPGSSDKPSKAQREEITKVIDKFRKTHAVVDATQEMRERGIIGPEEVYTIDDMLLSATRHRKKTKTGGKWTECYQLRAEPLLLSYSRATKEIISVPAAMLEIKETKKGIVQPEAITMSADRQAMANYLLRRIEVMKKDHEKAAAAFRQYKERRRRDDTLPEKSQSDFFKQSRTILYDTLFKETGQSGSSREMQRRNRDFACQCLEYWKAKKHIKDYKNQTKGRSITGIIIYL